MLCRVYLNVMDRKLLTAEKILGNAELLIEQLKEGKQLKIVTYPRIRAEARFIHFDIL